MFHSVRMHVIAALVLATSLLGALTAAPAGAAQPGTVPDITWGTSRADIDRTVGLMHAAGVRWVRTNVPWTGIQPDGRGSYNHGYLADIDYAVAKARAAGMRILMPVADGVPYWASADPAKHTDGDGAEHWNRYYRPRSNKEYAAFFRFVVDRYKAQGVHAYEVWNEPNLRRFWPSGVNAASYVQMLKAAYPAIKSADPSSTVVLGGLSGNDRKYLQAVYAADGKGYFDVAGVHDYAWGDPTKCWDDSSGHRAKDSFCGIEEMRRVMVQNGDAARSIWMTEFGWSTCNNASPSCYGSGVTKRQQGDYLTKAFRLLDSSYRYVKVALVYNFRGDDDPNDYEAETGLLTKHFAPKASYAAFKAYALTRAGSSAGGVGAARATRTSMALGPVAIAHSAVLARRGSRFLPSRITGQVATAARGTVLLRFQRRGSRGRWRTIRVRLVRLTRNGRFAFVVHRAGAYGRWRVRAEYRGLRNALPSRSHFRPLRLARF